MIEINTETKESKIIQEEATDLNPKVQEAFNGMDCNKEIAVTAKKSLKGMKVYIVIIIIMLLYFIARVISSS